jgi:urease subunit beta
MSGSPQNERPGSGEKVPMGTGRGGAIAITHPGADSGAEPGTPGEILYGEGPVQINVGRQSVTVRVVNTADRPITVGSHYHFAETNPGLEFDRKAAWGRRLNIVSGGLRRFDPSVPQEVELIPFGGRQVMAGFRGESGGRTHA